MSLDPERKLASRLRRNKYVNKVRELNVDKEAFQDLCDIIRRLAEIWSTRDHVNKAVAADLYVISHIVRNMIETMRRHQDQELELLEDMFLELDALIVEEAFYPRRHDRPN